MNKPWLDQLRALAHRMARSGGRRIVITPESAAAVAQALVAYADYLGRPAGERPAFTVDVWDGEPEHLIEVLAQSNNLLVARAAFGEAVRQRARYRVTLRAGIRVVAEYSPPAAGGEVGTST